MPAPTPHIPHSAGTSLVSCAELQALLTQIFLRHGTSAEVAAVLAAGDDGLLAAIRREAERREFVFTEAGEAEIATLTDQVRRGMVLARRFDAAGNELNPEFTLNTTTAGTQYNPRLAALSGGQFVAVYGDASGNDGSSYGVFSRVFNANGTQAVAEQVVSTTISGQQSGHDVAALAGGGYVAAWWSADNQLYGQRFDAAGAKLAGEFRISTVDTAPNNNFVRVTALASGGFVAAWDANGYEVYIQQFDAAGNKVDGPTQVNTTTASTQYYADVAAIGSGGNFVVTWAGYDQEAGAPSTLAPARR